MQRIVTISSLAVFQSFVIMTLCEQFHESRSWMHSQLDIIPYKYESNFVREREIIAPGVNGIASDVVDPPIEYISKANVASEPTALDSYVRHGGRRRRQVSMESPDKSISMLLADHSLGASDAEKPTAFVDWSLAPILDKLPDSLKNVDFTTTNNRNVALNGRSMAEAILSGNTNLWQWDYVIRSSMSAHNGNGNRGTSYYDTVCCSKLPYICGVDGMCNLDSFQDCELFCQCASNPAIRHCTRTIPRLKSVMKKLEKKFILELAMEKSISLPPEIEQQLNNVDIPTHISTTTPSIDYFLSSLEASPMSIQTSDTPLKQIVPQQQELVASNTLSTVTSTTTTASKGNTNSTTTLDSAVTTAAFLDSTLSSTELMIVSTVPTNTSYYSTENSKAVTVTPHLDKEVITGVGVKNSTTLDSAVTTEAFLESTLSSTELMIVSTVPTNASDYSTENSKAVTVTPHLDKEVITGVGVKNSTTTLDSAVTTEAFLESTLSSTELMIVSTFPTNASDYSTENSKAGTVTPQLDKGVITGVGNQQQKVHTTVAIENEKVSNSSQQDRCWQCEENGGTCVMGNDFMAHCVNDMADGCQHFQCLHGSCITVDGLYSCECHDGWIGPFCDQPCPIQCGPNGFCSRIDGRTNSSGSNSNNISGEGVINNINTYNNSGIPGIGCVCHWNYTGSSCDEKRTLIPHIQKVLVTSSGINTWQLIVVVVSTTVFLVTFIFLATYFLWRRQWLPLRKLVFFFQDYEEDDGKLYDAFISYKGCSNDEHFVLNHLYPKLEKELDFKLCLHFRDFPPGHPIANNIVYAIENSRRTIMILSPAYATSEWCRMEYQKAQHEMLRLRHRLIPVVLEDIQDVPGLDRNLQTILDTITYIKWPGEMENSNSKRSNHFWKLLQLSMPKKKPECSGSTTSLSIKPPSLKTKKIYFSNLVDSFSNNNCPIDSNLFNADHLKRIEKRFFDKNTSVKSTSNAGNVKILTSRLDNPKLGERLFSSPYSSHQQTATSQDNDCLCDSAYTGSDKSTTSYVASGSDSWKSELSSPCYALFETNSEFHQYNFKCNDENGNDYKPNTFPRRPTTLNKVACRNNNSNYTNPTPVACETGLYLYSTDGNFVQIRADVLKH